jgi:glycosyltransferase involved in cell wall biosynthesis
MKSAVKVSVIVPIYNVDVYLHQCINSIVNQSLKEIEIILVDDGSSDHSLHICEYFRKLDDRVVLIKKEKNEGLVSARKTGLQYASGKYAMYVDADDWIDTKYIEKIYSEALHYGVDAVLPSHIREFLGNQKNITNKIESGVYDNKRLKESVLPRMISFNQFFSHGITSYSWGKLFLRTHLIEFQMKVPDDIVMGEDAALVFTLLPILDSIYISDLAGYYYRQRPGSIVKVVDNYNTEAKKLSSLFQYLSINLSGYYPKYNFNIQLLEYVYALSLMRIGSQSRDDDKVMSELIRHQNFHSGSRVCLFSSGSFGQNIYKSLVNSDAIQLIDWVDEDYKESQMCGLPVSDIHQITSIDFDYVFIAALDPDVINNSVNKLISFGIPKEKITYINFDNDSIKQNINNMGFCSDSFRYISG